MSCLCREDRISIACPPEALFEHVYDSSFFRLWYTKTPMFRLRHRNSRYNSKGSITEMFIVPLNFRCSLEVTAADEQAFCFSGRIFGRVNGDVEWRVRPVGPFSLLTHRFRMEFPRSWWGRALARIVGLGHRFHFQGALQTLKRVLEDPCPTGRQASNSVLPFPCGCVAPRCGR